MPRAGPSVRSIRELIAQRVERAETRARRNGVPAPASGCAFCGAPDATHRVALLPRTRLREECGGCVRMARANEELPACDTCRAHKKGRGLYELYRLRFPFDRRFAERIPPALERLYLAAIAECHRCAHTLEQADIDGDGRLTVFDIDFVLHRR